ncbi:MAG: MBL fold metallo-hydrolase [Candidatus Altiarchaeota archaeon]
MRLTWFGNSAFRLDCGFAVYFDPYKARDSHDADIVLISHGHYDHLDPASIAAVSRDDTTVICPNSCVQKVESDAHGLSIGDAVSLGAVRIEAVASYNLEKTNHQADSCLGYVVEAEGKRVYHAGDTDNIPEMKDLGQIDVALLPVGGTYTMDWREAADAVAKIKPKTVIPMHYGDVAGTLEDAVMFRNRVNSEKTAKAVILKKGESIEI